MRLSDQKSNMFIYKLIFILMPQLIATLNNYGCSLFPLANVNWSGFLSTFCWQSKSTTGEVAPMEGSELAVGIWYGSHCLGLVVQYWPFVGTCGCHSHSKLTICVILLFVLAFATAHPTPASLLPIPLYMLAQF